MVDDAVAPAVHHQRRGVDQRKGVADVGVEEHLDELLDAHRAGGLPLEARLEFARPGVRGQARGEDVDGRPLSPERRDQLFVRFLERPPSGSAQG